MMGVPVTDGMAEVTWTLLEDLPDVRTYIASGTISAGVALASLQGVYLHAGAGHRYD